MKAPANAVFLPAEEASLEAVSKKEWLEISKNKILISTDIKAVIKFLKKQELPEPQIFFEADDVLGTIVEQVTPRLRSGQAEGLKIIIVSGDMDVLQLVEGERVVVFTLRKGIEDTVVYNEKKVLERYGFGPEHIVDFKGLKGDPSDNIVGVKGIGEKTATDIIKQFGTIENLYKKLESGEAEGKLKDKTIQLLKSHKKDAFFSKTLATIRRDAPVKFALPEKQFELNKEKLTKIFGELGFTSLIARINK